MQDSDSLHEKASNLYLQGNVEAALSAWNELLQLTPGDERALEGIRLCEQISGSESQSLCTSGESPFAVGRSPEPPVPEPVTRPPADDALSDLDLALDFKGGPAPGAPAGDDLGLGAMEFGTSSGDLPDSKPTAGESSAPIESWAWNANGPAEPEPTVALGTFDAAPAADPTVAPPGPQGEPPAAVELRLRVNELLASALIAMESKRHKEALRILERILILDETNEPALSLTAQAREKLGLAPDASSEANLDDDAMELGPLAPGLVELDQGDGAAIGVEGSSEALLDEPPVLEGDDFVEDHLEAPEVDADPQEIAGENLIADAALAEVGASDKRGRFSLPLGHGGRQWLVVVGVALAVAVGAFSLWGLFSGDGSTETIDPVVSAASGVEATPPPVEPVETPALTVTDPVETPTAGAAAGAATTDPRALALRLADLVSSGDEAMGDGRFADAVVAFNSAASLRPDDPLIEDRLALAGDGYRDQRRQAESFQTAIAAFDDADYTGALRLLYRLPADHDPELVSGYKTAGWFNLGLIAIGADNCGEARKNFEEAAGLSPDDADVTRAVYLAKQCAKGGGREYRRSLAELELRTFD